MPDSFVAGDTLKFYVPEGDYDASADTLVLELLSTATNVTVPTDVGTIVDNGDARWLVTIPAADTATLLDNTRYGWALVVTELAGEVYTIDHGEVYVRVDPRTQASGYDVRSHNRIVFEALETVIQGKATQDQAGYSIGGALGRAITRMSWTEIETVFEKYASRLRAEVRRERARRGLTTSSAVKVRFL